MTTVEDLAKARARLVETLSGRKPLKLNAAPPSNGYEEFVAVVKQNAAAQIKLNASKKEFVETLSHGTIHGGFDDGIKIMEISPDLLAKQAAARREMHERLAGRYRKPQKQNQCPRDNSTGAKNTTLDSPITPFGVAFTPPDMPITARCGTLTYQDIMDEQDSDEDSASPAVMSGRDGTADWSPREHQDTNFDADDDDEEYDPAEQSAKILLMYTGSDGRVRKHAAQHFLTVSGDGSQASMYAVPLSRMDDVSQTILYDSDALDEAFAIAAGRDSGLAYYGKMSRVIRIKQRNHMPLTLEQKDHVIRHMAAVEPTAAERDAATLGKIT